MSLSKSSKADIVGIAIRAIHLRSEWPKSEVLSGREARPGGVSPDKPGSPRGCGLLGGLHGTTCC